MKLRLFSLITLLIGFLLSMIGVENIPASEYILYQVMYGWPVCLMLFGACFIVSALFCLIFSKTVKTNCSIRTSAISLGLSAVGALGIFCVIIWYATVAFHGVSKHPISHPLSIALGVLCLGVLIVLIKVYFKFRGVFWSIKGFTLDVLTSVMYFPAFFYSFSFLYGILRFGY